MDSHQLSPTEQWQNLLNLFALVADREPQRLEEEASYCDLGGETEEQVGAALGILNELDPEKALQLFQEKNPNLEVPTSPSVPPPDQAYQLASGLLTMLST